MWQIYYANKLIQEMQLMQAVLRELKSIRSAQQYDIERVIRRINSIASDFDAKLNAILKYQGIELIEKDMQSVRYYIKQR